MNAIVANLLSLFLHLQVVREVYMTEWLTHSPTPSVTSWNNAWEVRSSSRSQEIHHTLWTPKFHYYIHQSLTPVPVLSQISPFQCPHPSHFLKIHLDVILPHMPRFPYHFPVCHSCLSHMCQMPCLTHSTDMITWMVLVRSIDHEAPYYAVSMPLRLIESQKNSVWRQRTVFPIRLNAV
jgi:hypothetical protein